LVAAVQVVLVDLDQMDLILFGTHQLHQMAAVQAVVVAQDQVRLDQMVVVAAQDKVVTLLAELQHKATLVVLLVMEILAVMVQVAVVTIQQAVAVALAQLEQMVYKM
jgi:hypothetical protein